TAAKTQEDADPEHGAVPAGAASAWWVLGRQLRLRWAHVWLPVLVLAVGLGLSVAAARWARQETLHAATLRFDAVATRAAAEVERRMTGYVEVLYGLRAMFSTGEVSREDFRRYAQALELRQKFPGFQVLNYAPYVDGRRRAE